MEQHDLIQGTPEWHKHRATHFNASDAPAMMGCSPYKSRTQLMDEMVTGITPEVDAATQRRFDDGHRFEDLARPLAEKIIGKRLYRVTGSEGKLSASFDGLTADDAEAFEHKSLNDEIRACFDAEGSQIALVPLAYAVQMEQQMAVSGCKRVLFMASKFDKSDELLEERHCWYYPDLVLREQIIAGWAQIEEDLKTHQPTIAVEKPKAEAIKALPAVFVQAAGMVTSSNLEEFAAAASSFIAAIKTELTTDQDFADAESTVKFCKEAEANLEATKASVLAQMTTVDEVTRTLDHIAAQLRDKRLMLDKLVKTEKESRKLAIVTKASNEFSEYLLALESEIKPIGLNRANAAGLKATFSDSIKGLKKLSAMQEAVDTALRDAKFAVDQEAKDVRAKLAWCKEHAAGMSALLPDLQALMAKPMEDFTLTITSRIEKQKADEASRLEAERAKMEAQANEKAEREAVAKLAENEARIRAEERAKAEAEQKEHDKLVSDLEKRLLADQNTPQRETVTHDGARPALVQTEPAAPAISVVQLPSRHSRPTDAEIIEALALNFRVHESKVIEWLLDMDLDEACERMAKEFA